MIKKITLVISVLTAFGCASTNKKEGREPSSVSVLAQKQAQSDRFNNSKSILEELTGKKSKVPFTDAQLRKMSISTQHYYAGIKAAESKNYILAIKQFNTVIKKYPTSKEVKLSLLAKSNLYKEMGLKEPASLNLRLAQQKVSPKVVVKKTQESKQITKQIKPAMVRKVVLGKKSASAQTNSVAETLKK